MSASTRGLVKKRGSPSIKYVLCLYVAGETANSRSALDNLKQICRTHLNGSYRIKVIDLHKNPRLARDHQILALPTLVRQLPRRSGRSSAICPIPNVCWWASTSSPVNKHGFKAQQARVASTIAGPSRRAVLQDPEA